MFKKEAEDFLKKSLKVDDDEFDFFKNEASCKEEIKRLTDFVEPREKRIAELEKENAELKKENAQLKKQQFSLRNERNTFLAQNEQYEKDLINFNENLSKAKELLR